MNFLSIDKDKLILSVGLKTCTGCHSFMVPWHEKIPDAVLFSNGIVKESYLNLGVCNKCIEKGGYPKECTICGKDRKFPDEFSYKLTYYAKYSDDETEWFFICDTCVKERSYEVIEVMAGADETDILYYGKN